MSGTHVNVQLPKSDFTFVCFPFVTLAHPVASVYRFCALPLYVLSSQTNVATDVSINIVIVAFFSDPDASSFAFTTYVYAPTGVPPATVIVVPFILI